jgi:hypothetical protein
MTDNPQIENPMIPLFLRGMMMFNLANGELFQGAATHQPPNAELLSHCLNSGTGKWFRSGAKKANCVRVVKCKIISNGYNCRFAEDTSVLFMFSEIVGLASGLTQADNRCASM